jgi:ABC-type microcin C transport system duplicated ATPase subunit YejF
LTVHLRRAQLQSQFQMAILMITHNLGVIAELAHQPVGIDVGLVTFAVFSDGTEIGNPRHFRAAQRRFRIAQRKVARRNAAIVG